MVEHYFKNPMTEAQLHRLEMALSCPPGVADFTPAEVEQLCAEYDEVDDFLDALEERVLNESSDKMPAPHLPNPALDDLLAMPPPAAMRRGLSTTSKSSAS
jgi:hypothetical protein